MSDIHALSGAYAVDALDDDEREQFEQHLAACPECRAEVRSFSETAALIAEPEAESPPPSLRDSVLSGIASTRPLPPESPEATPETTPETTSESSPTPAVRPLHRRTFPLLVAASVALVLVGLGIFGGVRLLQNNGSSNADLADQILNAPDAVSSTQSLAGGGELTLVQSPSLERAVMIGKDVPAPQTGTTYQLWLQQPGKGMVSAGLMSDAEEPTVLTGNAATAKAAAVSVEPPGGSTKPTTDPIALFPLKPTGGDGST
jgi:anti-sigma-K factor RskA